jgi:PAS domain S-box-containing protein
VQVRRCPIPLSSLCCLAIVGTLSVALTVLLEHRIAAQVEVPFVPLLGSLLLCLMLLVRLYARTRRSEASYRLVFDNNPQPMWVYDRDTLAFLAVNAAAVHHYGYSQAEFLGMTLKDICPPEDVAAVLDNVAYTSAGLDDTDTWRHRKRDGTIIEVEIPSHFLTFAGRPARLVLAHDITERRQAAIALAERTRRLDAVRGVAAEVARELDLHTLLDLILKHAVDLLGAKGGILWLWDEARQALTPCARRGREEYVIRAPMHLGEGIIGTVAQRREPLVINDYATSPYAHPAWVENLKAYAVVAAPLVYRERLIGAVWIDKDKITGAFTTMDCELLGLFADQAAIAIENARLYETLETRADRLHTLTRLNQLISSSLDMDAVLQEIARAAATLTGAPVVHFFIADEATQTLEAHATDLLHPDFPALKLRFDQGGVGWVATHRCPLNVPNACDDERFVANDWWKERGLSSFLAYPILFEDSLLAVLAFRGQQPFDLTPEDQALLDSFVVQAAVAIRNAALYTELQASEERTRLILENALDAVVTIDDRGLITGWNPHAEVVFGWSRADAIGRPLAETIIPPAYREAHQRGLQHFLATGEGPVLNRRFEITALHRNGREFPVELTISPIRTGKTFSFSAFIRDITERRRVEEALRTAKEAAEAASRAKSEFLANMSHEIRTPMNGIIGMTELALDTDLNAEQCDYLSTVKASAESLLSIINDILDFSKIEAGKLTIDTVAFSLRDILGTTLKSLALRAHDKGLELTYGMHPDVPDTLQGDPGRLRQILVNLMGNAIKFTDYGEVAVEVVRPPDDVNVGPNEAETASCLLHFAVRDTGIGIPLDKQRLIFEPFTQADGSATRQYGGTGLGLAIAKQLVEMMQGEIWLESTVDEGSTFHFTARFGCHTLAEEQSAGPERVQVRDLPVLIVDDNATNRRLLYEMLSHGGMRPTTVENGQAALSALARARDLGTPFPLVLIDALMPAMDGLTLAAQITHDPTLATAIIMMLTSRSQRHDAARCQELGIAAYLTKPIAYAELWQAVGRVLKPATSAAPPAPVVASRVPQETYRPLRVLLAEDNIVNQRLVARLMEKRGHTVVVVSTGRAALAALAEEPFDLVLMDVQMPDMDGLEATTAIRRWEQETSIHVPIIAMTAHALQGDAERCLAAGMDGYISKPMKPEDLYVAIDSVMALAG